MRYAVEVDEREYDPDARKKREGRDVEGKKGNGTTRR